MITIPSKLNTKKNNIDQKLLRENPFLLVSAQE
nr:MAG TPA: hypothetical protein [Caudoviricetes sp.]